MEDLPTSSKRAEDITAGDISCRDSGSTLIICLVFLEEVVHAVHYVVWSVYGNSNCH